MNAPVLTTKLYAPAPRADLVSRPRLVAQLTDGLTRKLSLICAPAGYGKTTLLSEWVQHIDHPTAWFSCDKGDNDLGIFLSYLVASLQSIQLQIDEQILKLAQSRSSDSVGSLLIPLINQISVSNQQFSLVLDDYHLIQNQTIHDTLCYLLDNQPQNMHLVIATRADPPLRLAYLRARGELCEIRADELRFTLEETLSFLNQRMKLGLTPADVSALAAKTEGWIAGLQLAAVSLKKHPDRHAFVIAFAGDDRFITDYLLDEALQQQPILVQDFLLHTSILDQLTASLCDAVMQRDDSKTILAEIEAANLFIVPLDNRRQWYRYHHLFTELLYVRLRKADPSLLPTLHMRASQWYEQQGYLNQAVTHAIQANDINQLEKLVQANMLAVLDVGESALLEEQLRSFQASIPEPNLWLSVARAWSSVYSGQLEAAGQALWEAQRSLSLSSRAGRETDKALGHIATINAYIADLQGDPLKGEEYAREALARLPKDDYLTIAFAQMMLATAFNRIGESAKAESAVLAAIQACESYPNSFIRIDALCMLSKTRLLLGQLHQAYADIQKALKVAQQSKVLGDHQLPISGFVYISQSILLYEWNELAQARKAVSRGLAMIEPWGEKDSYIAGLIQSALILSACGDYEMAYNTIDKARSIATELNYWIERVAAVEAWLNARNGRMDLANHWLDESRTLHDLSPTFQQEFIYRHLAYILLFQGDLERAAKIVNRLLPIVEAADSPDILIRTLVLHAISLYRLGKEDESTLILTRALDLAAPGDYVRVFLDGGDTIAQCLYLCAQQEKHTRYCARLLDEFTQTSPQLETPIKIPGLETLFVPLSEREREVLQVIAEGCSNKEISQRLYISLATVKSHTNHIFGKLGVKNRTEAVAKARLLGILSSTNSIE